MDHKTLARLYAVVFGPWMSRPEQCNLSALFDAEESGSFEAKFIFSLCANSDSKANTILNGAELVEFIIATYRGRSTTPLTEHQPTTVGQVHLESVQSVAELFFPQRLDELVALPDLSSVIKEPFLGNQGVICIRELLFGSLAWFAPMILFLASTTGRTDLRFQCLDSLDRITGALKFAWSEHLHSLASK